MNIEEKDMCQKEDEYIYLVERIRDKKKFVMIGNLKSRWMGVSPLYHFVSKQALYGQKTPFGRVCNISSCEKYDSDKYKVIDQVAKITV